jgi:hypothetical protein
MSEISIDFKKKEIQDILKSLREEIKTIEPTFTYKDGLTYSISEKIAIPKEKLESTIKELSDSEILIPIVRSNVIICPLCNSHRFMISLYCPTCGSSSLQKGTIIEHLPCGYIDFERNFQRNGKLICPKCRKILKAIGVDYRSFTAYKCLACGAISSTPKQLYKCENEHTLNESELIFYEIKAYELNPNKRTFIEKMYIDFKPLLKEISNMGWYVRSPAIIPSQSGIEHEFTFALWAPEKRGEGPPDIVIDLYTSNEEVAPTIVLAFQAKTMDIQAIEKVLIVMPKLNEKAKVLAKSYGISFIEAEASSEIVKKTNSLLLSMVKKMEKESLEEEAKALETILGALEKVTSSKDFS